MKDEAKQVLKEFKENKFYYAEAIEFCYNYQLETGADFEIITTEELDDLVEHEAQNGWHRVAYFLAGIENMNEDYYRIDGYGNAKDITASDIECWLEDIINGYYE